MKELPQKWSKLSEPQARQVLEAAFSLVTGEPPSAGVLDLLVAQTALETGQWNLPNFNWGGVKAIPSDKFFQYLKCSEIINGKELKFEAADRSHYCKFAAYESAQEGAIRYVATLLHRPHWKAGLLSEDPETFIKALSTPPVYFTASPPKYLREFERLMTQFSQGFKKKVQGSGSSYSPASPLQDLHFGLHGDAVRFIQILVGAKEDGYFGERTEEKVAKFQALHGLPVSGKIDLKSWMMLARHGKQS
jgi:hypothetical protein